MEPEKLRELPEGACPAARRASSSPDPLEPSQREEGSPFWRRMPNGALASKVLL